MEEKSSKMKGPFIAIETDSNDVLIFDSLWEAQSKIEPYDVDEWEVYDVDGRVICISLLENDAKLLGMRIGYPPSVRLEPSERMDPERLRGYLRRYLVVIGEPDPGPESPLNIMSEMIQERQNRK
jgi:hypothetical protein